MNKILIAAAAGCLLLTGCAGASSSAPDSGAAGLVTLSDMPQKSGEFAVRQFDSLLFAPGVTAESLAGEIAELVIYPESDGYEAVVPVNWKDADNYIYEKFEITLGFDSARKLRGWSADSTELRYDWIEKALGSLTAWDGQHDSYSIEWRTDVNMFLLMQTANGALRYSAEQSIAQNKQPQTDTGHILEVKCGLEPAQVTALIGEPLKTEQDGEKTVCFWEFGTLTSIVNQGVTWSRTDELLPADFRCEFTDGKLTSADYRIYGLLESANEEITKVLGRMYQASNPDGFSKTDEGYVFCAVPSLGGDLTMIPDEKVYQLKWTAAKPTE